MAGLSEYLVKRFMLALVTLFVVTSATWALFELLPGDPTDAFYGNPNFSQGDIVNLAVGMGLEDKYNITLNPADGKDFTYIEDSPLYPRIGEDILNSSDIEVKPPLPLSIDFMYIGTATVREANVSAVESVYVTNYFDLGNVHGVFTSWNLGALENITFSVRINATVNYYDYSTGEVVDTVVVSRTVTVTCTPNFKYYASFTPSVEEGWHLKHVVGENEFKTTAAVQHGKSVQEMGIVPYRYMIMFLTVMPELAPIKSAVESAVQEEITSTSVAGAYPVVETLDADVAPQELPNLPTTITYTNYRPWYKRYVGYLVNMFTFSFGRSTMTGRPVRDIMAETIPRTLLLFGTATILAYLIGIKLGTYIAWKRGGKADAVTVVSSLFFYNMPSFWTGLVLLYIFAYALGWFPLGGFSSGNLTGPGTLAYYGFDPNAFYYPALDILWHMALPLIVLLLISFAGTTLLMRTAMLDTLNEDYITTAIAKGLPEKVVMKKHARRNALLPIVTSFVIALGFSVGGAVILEQVFSYQGVGFYYITSLLQKDYFLAGASLFIIAVLVIIGNLIADILYGFLDPRVRVH